MIVGVSVGVLIALVAVLFVLARPQRMHGFPSCRMGHNVRASALVLWSLVRGLLAPSRAGWAVAPSTDISGVRLCEDLRRTYGTRCVLGVLGKPLLLLLDPRDVTAVLRDSPDPYQAGRLKARFFRGLMDGNVGISSGAAWRTRRTLTERCMPSSATVRAVVSRIVGACANKPTSYEAFQRDLAQPIAGTIVAGNAELARPVFDALGQTTSNWWRFLLLRQSTLTLAQQHALRDALQRMFETAPDDCMVGALRALPGGNLALTEIPHWLFPTAGSASFVALALLLRYPVDRARALGGDRAYLRACVLEAMRLNNAVLTLLRTAGEENLELDGEALPPGTQVGTLMSHLLMAPERYPDPQGFHPERADDFVFSTGPQKCPGKDVALDVAMELFLHMLRRWEWADPAPTTSTQKQRINPFHLFWRASTDTNTTDSA